MIITSSALTPLAATVAALAPATNLPTGWSYLGCYTDSVANRVLGYASYTDGTSQIAQNCISFCGAKGYPYAGTEWSRECWCGFSLAGSSSVNAIDCDYPCTGDSSQACGGPTRLTVYQSASRLPKVNPGVNGYSSIGCYSDSVTARVLGSSVQVPGGSSNNTVVGCTATCSALEYDYSGVEYAGECFCGNSIANGQAVVSGASPDNGCNMPCRGDVSEYCGGANRINIYQNSSKATATTATPSTTPTPTPARTNIVTNGDFELGNAPWQVAYHPSYSPSDLVSGGSVVTSVALSGALAWQIYESGFGDSGFRSLCLQQTFYHPHTGSYTLSFYYGRQANPAPGASTTDDNIAMSLYVDNNIITTLNVCNPTLGGCSFKRGSNAGYDLFSGTLDGVTQGDHTVKICAVYLSTKRGTQDYFLVDNVSAYQVSS